MKRYSVNVEFFTGQDMHFYTDTNVLKLQPVHINGGEFIMTKEQWGVNLVQVKRMEVIEIGRGKIGEFVTR